MSSLFCRNVLHNFIYMKVLQECSSKFLQECSIFNTPPHSQSDIFLNPSILLNLANCILPIPFINLFAIISSLLQYFNLVLFIVTISLMQWNLIMMCLALPWCWGFFVIAIVDSLSKKNVIGSTEFSFISIRSRCNHINSWAAFANAMYSASAVYKATQVCFLLFQLIAAPLIIKTESRCRFLVIMISSPICIWESQWYCHLQDTVIQNQEF